MLSGAPYSASSESELPLTEIHSAVDSLSASKLSDVHERQMAPASVSVWLFQSFEPMADFLGLDAFHSVAVEQPPLDVYLPVVLKTLGQTAE